MAQAAADRCDVSGQVYSLVASLARDSTHRLVAALARRLGTGRIAIAEDAVQHALLQALSSWPFGGVPDQPSAWLAVVATKRAALPWPTICCRSRHRPVQAKGASIAS